MKIAKPQNTITMITVNSEFEFKNKRLLSMTCLNLLSYNCPSPRMMSEIRANGKYVIAFDFKYPFLKKKGN